MKKILIFAAVLASVVCVSCGNVKTNGTAGSEDTMMAVVDEEMHNDTIINKFFDDFQKKNPLWWDSEKGTKEFRDAFANEMTTNIEFAHACIKQNIGDIGGITIADYKSEDGTYGELISFLIRFNINLAKPLPNGDKTTEICFEVINKVPATVEDHYVPYITDNDTCGVTKPYRSESLFGANVGTYLIAEKKNK